MLQAIIDIAGPAQILYFAQDSIHVMTAYAAVFLIKVLMAILSSVLLKLLRYADFAFHA